MDISVSCVQCATFGSSIDTHENYFWHQQPRNIWDNFLDPQIRAKKIGGASSALMQLLAL